MNGRYGFVTLCCFSACCLVLMGCSGGAAFPKIKGQVLLDNEPVSDARVEFKGKAGQTAVTDKDGKFEFDGSSPYLTLKPGTYKVVITKLVDKKTGAAITPENYPQQMFAGTAKNSLPPVYEKENTTPLTAEIKEGNNELKPFELKSK